MAKTQILVLCTGNSARSQMAEGLMRHLAGQKIRVLSAGVSPSRLRSEAVQVMKEIGIDISQQFSKSVDRFLTDSFDYVITVCDHAKEHCPVFPGEAKRIHWSFADPAAVEGDERTRLDAFRRVREKLRERIDEFLQSVPHTRQ